jgi:hypothetical protein
VLSDAKYLCIKLAGREQPDELEQHPTTDIQYQKDREPGETSGRV